MNPPPHHWRLVAATEVPDGSAWLGPRERKVEQGLTIARRRQDWRSGRWAAKGLGQTAIHHEWEVIARQDGSPQLWHRGIALPTPLSISHRAGMAGAVLSVDERPVGIDLELNEPHSERFVRDFFTEAEHERATQTTPALRALYASAVWSAKEAVLKCLRQGLNRDTRSVLIDIDPRQAAAQAGQWFPFRGHDRDKGELYDGWWTLRGPLIVTIASEARGHPA